MYPVAYLSERGEGELIDCIGIQLMRKSFIYQIDTYIDVQARCAYIWGVCVYT